MLVRLASSRTEPPPVLCLLGRSERMLVMLLRSSSLYSQLPLGLAGLVFPEVDGAFDGGVEGDCRLGGRLDLFGVAGLWIEMARGTDDRTILVLGFFVRARSLGSLSDGTNRLSQVPRSCCHPAFHPAPALVRVPRFRESRGYSSTRIPPLHQKTPKQE